MNNIMATPAMTPAIMRSATTTPAAIPAVFAGRGKTGVMEE